MGAHWPLQAPRHTDSYVLGAPRERARQAPAESRSATATAFFRPQDGLRRAHPTEKREGRIKHPSAEEWRF